jgi:excisionase family DNA binding protein
MASQNGDEPLVLTPKETAKLLRISRGSCYEALKANVIPNVRVGKRFLVPRHALMEWLNGGGANHLRQQK